MGDFVEINDSVSGYFAAAEGGGPGVVVIQEWWGVVPHIIDVCDRFAAAGFSAIAPDLYGGRTTTEPDEAGKLMMSLNIGQAAAKMGAAIDFLASNEAVTSEGVGVVGYCMGGGLALVLAAARPDAVVACAPYYGLIPWEGAEPDWSTVTCPIRGHYAENDGFFGPGPVAQLQAKLDAAGVDAVLTVHPGVEHAFFNDTRPEVYDPATATAAWDDTISFFRSAIR